MQKETTKKKYILVTGGNGYIGTHLVHELVNQNFNVISIDNNINSTKNNLNKNVKYFFDDFANEKLLREIFDTFDVVLVCHLAALISVNESVKNPEFYFLVNTEKTNILVNLMKEYSINNIVFSSTAAVYGNSKNVPLKEDEVKLPVNPYGESKLRAEKIIKKSNLKYVILRYFNVAGVYKNLGYRISENPTHIIPSISKVLLNKNEIFKVFGFDYFTKDGTAIRDYVHVQDLVFAHIYSINYLLKLNSSSQELNLGSGSGFSIKEIIETTEKSLNVKLPFEYHERRSGDPEILIASNKKAKNILNWFPKFNISEMIISDFEWNLKNKKTIY